MTNYKKRKNSFKALRIAVIVIKTIPDDRIILPNKLTYKRPQLRVCIGRRLPRNYFFVAECFRMSKGAENGRRGRS